MSEVCNDSQTLFFFLKIGPVLPTERFGEFFQNCRMILCWSLFPLAMHIFLCATSGCNFTLCTDDFSTINNVSGNLHKHIHTTVGPRIVRTQLL